MEQTIAKYKEIINRIDDNITQAEKFRQDLMNLYSIKDNFIDDVLKIQGMVLKIDDYISQKHEYRVQLERQLIDIEEQYAKQE